MNLTTTHEKALNDAGFFTPAIGAYMGKINITAQATYDQWPEASGMRGNLWDLAVEAGISLEQYRYDLEHANIDNAGGRW